jgi:AcrR family transcriptional regulator
MAAVKENLDSEKRTALWSAKMYRSVQAAAARRRPRVPRTAESAAVRAEILGAAEAVFARTGYAGATTQAIARRARVQKRMLFYYFRSKDDLYTEVLDQFLARVQAIHERFRRDPGPLGLHEVVAGLTRFVAANPNPVRILMREIMDEGTHLRRIVSRYAGPLFAAGMEETQQNMRRGLFRREDPMHTLVNVGGLTFFYFLITPLLRQVWDRDPLAPETLEERILATSRFILGGLTAGAKRPVRVAATSGAR